VGDVNGDGELDLVVSSRQTDHVSALFGRGDGTFGTAVSYQDFRLPGPVIIADMSGDGKPDLVVPGILTDIGGGISVRLGNGDGTFQPGVDYPTFQAVDGLAVTDFNRDGVLDMISVNNTDDETNVTVFLGSGDGSFPPGERYVGGRFAVAVAVADIDGDGNPDIATTHDQGTAGVRFGTGDGTLPIGGRGTAVFVGSFPTSMVVADASGDGKLDLVVANNNGDNVSVVLGNGDGTFQNVAPPAGPPNFLFIADLDADGKPDAVSKPRPIGPSEATGVDVRLGNGDGTFGTPVSSATDLVVRSATPADVNHDGKPDIIALNESASSVATLMVLLGNGDGTFQPGIDQPVASGISQLATVDLDSDGNADLVETFAFNNRANIIRVQLANGDGTFQIGIDYPMETAVGAIATGDFNGDDRADLAVRIGPDTLRVLLGNDDGTFQPKMDHLIDEGGAPLIAADFNSDGKLDLFIYISPDSNHTRLSVMLGVGDGTFMAPVTTPGGSQPGAFAVADVTGDGKPDLVKYNGFLDRTLSVWPGDGDGTFQPRTDYGAAGEFGTTFAIADVTSDGKADILVSGGPIFVATCLP
jgi:hypothetical protein